MGVCNWFKKISGNKRKKEISPVKLEIQPDSIDSKDAKDTYSTGNKSGFLASGREVIGRKIGTKEIAATRIQSAFRAYKARKALRYLNGISRFQALVDMDALTKQASNALEILHFWSKIQAEISARRLSATEGQIKQMKLGDQLKVESKLHELEMKWCVEPEMEETVSKIQQRAEAANKRERALAYAFSHQWRANSNRYFGQAYYDLSKESWGWKWIERWIAVCRCEAHVVVRPVVSPRAGPKPKPKKVLVAMGMEKVQQKQAIVLPEERC
ncbi:protein IQ-DOMAIN 1-like [Cynara cardunculus var. scolymus]|uniref:protein IQ-DOMAIN 1-like n=1 Tax=Cynara cardunculus var. scolymus TaxID=59895 RepID=UPI000D6268A5|nr:protein IQ-DOMAIN 1-like [Cynara cardunculus var. scolymus]